MTHEELLQPIREAFAALPEERREQTVQAFASEVLSRGARGPIWGDGNRPAASYDRADKIAEGIARGVRNAFEGDDS